jgi:regulator of PEP synthase PpsR (kinase-PPPase family)
MPPHDRRRHVFVVSDATGDTCERVARAALSQFQGTEVVLERVPKVRTDEQIAALMERVRLVHGVVVHTMVSVELRQAMTQAGLQHGVPTIDILGPLLTRLSEHLELSPLAQPGLFRHLDQAYWRRLEAVDFTVKHDDGLGIGTIGQAEIVLVGVSRSSKTPVSLYLSFRGWKVANVPFVPGIPLPPQLFHVEARRVVGFTLDPAHLRLLRLTRQRHLGTPALAAYVDPDAIRHEIRQARQLCIERDWPVLDVTAKAIEEVSTEVMQTIFLRTGQKKSPLDTE